MMYKDKIIRYLEVVINRTSSNGRFKQHSNNKLLLIWLVAIGFGILSLIEYPSASTIIFIFVSVFFLCCGLYTYRKKDYQRFLYYAYNAAGLLLSIIILPLNDSINLKGEMITIIVLALSIIVGSIVAYIDTYNKITKGWDGSDNINTAQILAIIGWLIGAIATKIIADNIQALVVTSLCAIIMGLYITPIVIMYIYSRKYDPNCDLLKIVNYKENYERKTA